MSWQFFIGMSVLAYSFAVLLQKVILADKSTRPVAFSIISQILCAFLAGVVGWLQGQVVVTDLTAVWPQIALMTVLYGMGSVLIALALKYTEASKFTVLFATRGIVTIAVAALMLGEKLTVLQLSGAGLIFLGVIAANWQAKKLQLQLGDWLALAAALCFGVGNVNDRSLLQQLPLYAYIVIAFLLPPLLVAVFSPKEISAIPSFFRPNMIVKTLGLSVLYVISAIGFFAALQIAPNAAQVATVNLTSVILIVVLSLVLLRERERAWMKLLGAIVSFVGLLLIG